LADVHNDILAYAEGLYAKSIQEMERENFRRAEIYAAAAYGAAAFLVMDKRTSEEIQEHAGLLEEASWRMSQEAHAALVGGLLEPKLSGNDDLADVRIGVRAIAQSVLEQR